VSTAPAPPPTVAPSSPPAKAEVAAKKDAAKTDPAPAPAEAKSTASQPAGETKAPEVVLRDRNLKREGRFFVIDDESMMNSRMADVKDAYRKARGAWEQYVQGELLAEEMRELAQAIAVYQNALNAEQNQVNRMRPRNNQQNALRQQMQMGVSVDRANLSASQARLAFLRSQPLKPQDLQKAKTEADSAILGVKDKISEVRQFIETVKSSYAELAQDEVITKALSAAGAGTTPLKLGPSDKFNTKVQELNSLEKSLQQDSRKRPSSKSKTKKKAESEKKEEA
jgi:hypothetical protein